MEESAVFNCTYLQSATTAMHIDKWHIQCFARSQSAHAESANSSKCRRLEIQFPEQSVASPAAVSCHPRVMRCLLVVASGRCWTHMGRPTLRKVGMMIIGPSAQLEHSALLAVSCTVTDLLSQYEGEYDIERAQTAGSLGFRFPSGIPTIYPMNCVPR